MSEEKHKPGDKVIIKVGGKEYETVIGQDGVQRFPINRLISWLFDSKKIDLNRLAAEYRQGLFSQEEYMRFNMDLGYSVSGFAELSAFQDLEIENPVWEEREPRLDETLYPGD